MSERWMVDGLCTQVGGDLFFPEKGGSVREAKSICAQCPVIDKCREYGINHPSIEGVWGGLTRRQRQRRARERASAREAAREPEAIAA